MVFSVQVFRQKCIMAHLHAIFAAHSVLNSIGILIRLKVRKMKRLFL
jgi:hypothetical protein